MYEAAVTTRTSRATVVNWSAAIMKPNIKFSADAESIILFRFESHKSPVSRHSGCCSEYIEETNSPHNWALIQLTEAILRRGTCFIDGCHYSRRVLGSLNGESVDEMLVSTWHRLHGHSCNNHVRLICIWPGTQTADMSMKVERNNKYLPHHCTHPAQSAVKIRQSSNAWQILNAEHAFATDCVLMLACWLRREFDCLSVGKLNGNEVAILTMTLAQRWPSLGWLGFHHELWSSWSTCLRQTRSCSQLS